MNDAVKAAWMGLQGLEQHSLSALFADPGRLDLLSSRLDLPGGAIRFDWSKTHLDAAHLAAFEALAEAVGFRRQRAAMFAGEPINVTEGRAVEHTALRGVGRE
ncbi:MAG TPA: glucose-6-phosphate isomerase, partial [Novosphingobium sp.]|nr:glucose-6-phosphate isomerase [Novosphingobium sp.]